MILAPQEINPDYTTDEIKKLVEKISYERNVVVIVPSGARAKAYWSGSAAQILDKDSIQSGIAKLRNGHVGLTVLVNKYDGIDLPGEACELLVIDGLPEVHGLIERLEMTALDGTRPQLLRQIQRVEQGMGRGVRSSDDHCVVLLLGARLSQRLHEAEANVMFSPATRAQVELGRSVAAQVRGKPLSELESVLDLCLDQDDNWVQASRNAVVKGPDNLWALGGLNYLVIECKSGATSAPKISKKDTNQLNGSIVWFKQTYDASCTFTPIMVHPKVQFETAASPDPAVKIINQTGLNALKGAVRAFATASASSGKFRDAKEVERQLKHHKLDAGSIIGLAAVPPSKK